MKRDSKRCFDITTPESIHSKDESKRGSVFAFILSESIESTTAHQLQIGVRMSPGHVLCSRQQLTDKHLMRDC